MFFLLLILNSITTSALFTILPPAVVASPDITVILDPSSNSYNPGESFTIDINITGVTDLWSWGLKIGWSGGLLTGTNVVEGPFLNQGGATVFASKQRTTYVDLGCTLLVTPGVDGGGNLASATFQVTDTGNCTLDLYDVTLLDSGLNVIEDWYKKDPPDDGYFYTTHPVAKEVSNPPYSEFFYTPNPSQTGHPIAGETLTFDASACYDPDDPYDPSPGGIVAYEWDFGDGTPVVTETDPITTHVYATNDTYTGNLTITDDDGETDTETFTIGVKLHDIAIIQVTATPTEVKVGETVSINVTILNEGSESEYLNVTVYYDSHEIETQLFKYIEHTPTGPDLRIVLPSRENHTMTWGDTTDFQPLIWDTTGITPGIYTISAYAYLVLQANISQTLPDIELDLTDNTFSNDQVAVGSHDIAVTSVTCSPEDVSIGDFVSINVTVANYGDFSETFNLTAYYDSVPIETQPNISLDAKADKDLTFTYAFVGEGVYTIKAEASAVHGETDIANNLYLNGEVNVTRLLGVPVANFSHSPENPMVNEEATFNSTSYDEDGSIVSWEWDFDNDDIIDATTGNATWTYTETGDYVVTLTVIDNDNLNGSKQVVIAVYASPTANFTYTPEKSLFNETVTFDASASTPNGGTIISYEWDFDYDGITFNVNATGIDANHTYTEFGTYTVMLNVTDSEDLSNNASELIKIYALPIANFTYSPSEDVMTKETITFNATDSYDLDGSIESYMWDFGDGTTINATDPIATHIYTTPTSTGFSVTLEVIDNDGLISDPPASVSIKKIGKTHDIAITDVILSSNVVATGENLTISVTAKNEGDPLGAPLGGPKTFDVIAFYNDTQIGAAQSVTDLAAGAENTLTFVWDTTGVDSGVYTIKAIAETTKRELNATNNELTGGTVTLSARVTSTISVFTYPANISVGESTTISGSIAPTRAGATVTISYRLVTGTWSTLITVTTEQNSQYSYDWAPTTAGTYEVKANWPGDENTMADESNVKTVSVHPQGIGILSVFAHPANVTVGESTTINGTMFPAQAGAHLAIDHRRNNGTNWSTLAVVITYATGYYEYIWTPRTAGTYELMVSWLGNEITPAANSTTTLTVEASTAFPLEIIVYAGIAIAAVITVSVVIYFVIIKKPKP